MARLIFFMLAIFLTTSTSQICRKTEMVLKEVPVTYQYTYEVVVRDSSCWFINCLRTETKSAKDVNMVQQYEPVDKYVCCEGYEEINQDGNSTCKPKCSSNCQNGFCIEPETCACDDGYTNDPLNPNTCLPLCVTSTSRDYCNSPNKIAESACTLGYYKADACHDMCSESCLNGFCIGHDTCLCKPGYIKTDKFVCVNNCTDCDCNKGWYSEGGVCKPICEDSCGNGTCIAPNICNCSQGYEQSKDTNKCEPICDCVGVCIAPNICSCEMPFDVELIGDKEVCVITEKGKESNSDVTTTDNINTVTEEEYHTKVLSVNNIMQVHNDKEAKSFLSKYWLYCVLSAICTVIIISLVIFYMKRRGKLSSEDNAEIAVTYQKNP